MVGRREESGVVGTRCVEGRGVGVVGVGREVGRREEW